MRRRGPRPAKSKEAKPPVARKSPKSDGAKLRDLEKRLTEALKDKAEALEQQTATADILRVISRSPGDIQPVFDAIVQNAVKLCEGLFGTVLRLDGDRLHLAAHHNLSPAGRQAYREHYPVVVHLRETVASGAILDRRVVQVIDSNDPAVPPRSVAMARATGFRGVVVVPMLRDGEPIGVINVARQERGPFTERQVALLRTFADQAVIAIENVRLFTETKEALEQQTATGEILRVISSSPTDVQPVFETIVRGASGLLGGLDCIAVRFDGTRMHLLARHNPRAGTRDALTQLYPQPPTRTLSMGRVILDKTIVHIPDVREDAAFDQHYAELIRLRGVLAVPIKRDDSVIGGISVSRSTPGHFSERQIALLQTFADQAVIAIENVRLFNETKEALDQQTATGEILRVIASSPTGVRPVFEAIAAAATTLCGADFTGLFRFDGNLIHFEAQHGWNPEDLATSQRAFPQPAGEGSVTARAILAAAVVQVADVSQDPDVVGPLRSFRTVLSVPMLQAGRPLGAITVARRAVGPFSEPQIALLRTFAEQAVIAIENVRLFTELQASNRELTTALDQQTTTSDILRVISQSQTDVQPVFDAIVSSAIRLMGAQAGVLTRITGDCLELAAFKSSDDRGEATIKAAFPLSLQSDGVHAKAIRDRAPINIAEAQSDARLRGRTIAHAVGYQSLVAVPMILQDVAVGTISATRREPGGFTDDEIALLQTFADQAVIAIENVRLFTELQASNRELTTALDTQTATGDILRVISRSQTDVQPVFEAIVDSAVRLLRAHTGALTRIAGDQIEIATLTSADEAGGAALRARFPQSLHSEDPHAQAIRARAPLNFADAQTDPRWPEASRAYARARDYRSAVVVPMSLTDTSTKPSFGTAATSIRPPSGVNLIAFDKRFRTTCRIFRSSARISPTRSSTADSSAIARRPARSRTSIKALSMACGRWKSACSSSMCPASIFDRSRMSLIKDRRCCPDT